MRHLIACALLLTLCACQPSSPLALSSVAYPDSLANLPDQPMGNVPQLVETFRANGVMVEPIGGAALEFLTVEGQMIAIDGERIQVYEYPDIEAAAAAAGRFSPDGGQISTNAGVLLVNWVATPHLYRSGCLLVVYLGDNPQTLAHLDRALGTPFAGGANPYAVVAATDIR